MGFFPVVIAFGIASVIIVLKKREQLALGIPMDTFVEEAYAQHGPSDEMLHVCGNHFSTTHKQPTMTQQIQLLEVRLLLQQFEMVEVELMQIRPETLPVNLRMRFFILQMQHAIMTGNTNKALNIFAGVQDFAEKYLLYHEEEMLPYFDCAATVCALSGDFEETERYCAAMESFLQKRSILTSELFLSKFARIKSLFLLHQTDAAIELSHQTQSEISRFRQYRYHWEHDFMMRELQKTQMFRQETGIRQQTDDGGMVQTL